MLLHALEAALPHQLRGDFPELQLPLHRVAAKVLGKVELSGAVEVQKTVDEFRVPVEEDLRVLTWWIGHCGVIHGQASQTGVG